MATPALSKSELERGIQRFLKMVGKQFQEFLRAKINRKYPPASRVGEYPARRTGSLRASVGFKQGPSSNSITLGVINDVLLKGKKALPTRYAAVLEFSMYRKLVMDAWEDFWPTIDNRIIVKLGSKLSKELEVVRLTKNYGSKEEYLELRGLEDLIDSGPTIAGREAALQELQNA